MDREIVSCCGVECSQCESFPAACKGCPAIEGNVFWLQYTGGDICDIYACGVKEKGLAHCGLCGELPCERYSQGDPTKSPEENEIIFQKQLALLRELDKQ